MKIYAGDVIKRWGKEWLVEQVYSVGRKYRKRHDLYYPNRIRIRELKNGFVTDRVDDFALLDGMEWDVLYEWTPFI